MPNHQVLYTSQTFSVGEWVRANLGRVAKTMFPNGDVPPDFNVHVLVSTHERLVLQISAGKEKVIVKVFNSELRSSVSARYRETSVQYNIHAHGLCPKLLHFREQDDWIMSEFVDGCSLEDVIDGTNVLDFAKALGEWYAKYTDVLQAQAAEQEENWLHYLKKYDWVATISPNKEEKEFIENLPIRQRVVAKTDAVLENFLVASDGALIGIDFEKAELKPYGFDILVTARILVRLYPHLMLEVTQALSDGFGRGTDVVSKDDFLTLVRFFASNTAYTVTSHLELRKLQYLNAFNKNLKKPVKKIIEAPYFDSPIVEQDAGNKQRLADFLRLCVQPSLADATGRREMKVIYAVGKAKKEEPDNREAAFCGTCQGSCCTMGAKKMAFLRAEDLHKTKNALGLKTDDEAIHYYVSLVPERHVQGSCYFHTQTGCAIPRALRSDACNNFECTALRQFQEICSDISDAVPILTFNTLDDQIMSAQLVKKGTVEKIDASIVNDQLMSESRSQKTG